MTDTQLSSAPASAVPVGYADSDVIRVCDVVKRFGSRTVLDQIRLEVRRGETLVILGGSGSGKSTLLRMMIGNLHPEGGSIISGLAGSAGKTLAEMSPDQLDDYRRHVGVLFQSGALFNSMSVADNVALPLREHTDLPDETIRIMVKIKLELVGLREHAERMPAELSGGMKKRAGLARALALDPEVLFYDEPSAGLDPVTSAQIDQLIINLNKRLSVTSVVVTHEMDSAFRIGDRMVLLHQGKFVVSGTPSELRASTDPLVYQFINGLPTGPLTDLSLRTAYESDLLGPEY